jgi:Transposase DDE domain
VSGLVNDALAVLAAVADGDLGDEQAEAVALLALVAGQDVEPGDRPGSWRLARRVARDRVTSTVDPQARHARKTTAHRRDGYKAHIAAEPESGLVTECALTAASVPDGPTGVEPLAAEEPGLEVLADSAYGRSDPRGAARCRPYPDDQAAAACQRGAGRVHHPRLPHRPPGWHPQVPGGPHHADYQLGSGQLHPLLLLLPAASALHHRQAGPQHPPPPPRGRATRRPPPRGDPQLPAQLPALAADDGTLHRLAVADGCRRVPYRGIERNDGWWSLRVAAVNLRRLLAVGLTRQGEAWALA